MRKIKAWSNAARLRTLPLSLSGVITGTGLANYYQKNDAIVFMLALLATIAFQVTSNFANDYGDGVKGTDNEDRVGPKRALQSGLLSSNELKKGILIASIISLVLVIALVFKAFSTESVLLIIVFLALGLLSIWAAIKYTVGESAYGYKGLGDLFVFLFFGLVGVLGSMYLYTKTITLLSIFPAIAIGALSTGVLNLNNLRDYNSDKKVGKETIIVKIGQANGKIYHYFLMVLALSSILIFVVSYAEKAIHYLPLLYFVPILLHIWKVNTTKDYSKIDAELKKLALSTFFLALLIYISSNIFS